MASPDLTYSTDKTCPVCKKDFPATKVRSRLKMLRQDTDFNIVFEELNPLYYTIWICPHCGYAAQDTFFSELSEKAAEKLKNFLMRLQVNVDFSGARTREQAIILFKVAIFMAEMIEAVDSRLAGLYLRLGWLYREAEDTLQEEYALEKALEHYENALYKEKFPIGNMNNVTAEFLIAELQRRTGKAEQAATSFGRLITNPQTRAEKRIMDLSRDAWNELKGSRSEINDVL